MVTISPAMNLYINGEARTFADPATPAAFTLAALIESLAMKSDRVAVELNRDIVPRNRWPETPLKDGDRLEIVHFVGGGMEKTRPLTEPS
jgi:sulfur carrier protein